MRLSYTLLIFTFLLIIYSCSFPNKALLINTTEITKHLPQLKSMLLDEFSTNTNSYLVYEIKNPDLKRYLLSYGIDNLSITYKAKHSNEILDKKYSSNLTTAYDSTIVLSWNKSRNDKMIFESLIYFFAILKPLHSPTTADDITERQINDSIWLQKYVSTILIIH